MKMQKTKKRIALLVSLLMVLVLFAACGEKTDGGDMGKQFSVMQQQLEAAKKQGFIPEDVTLKTPHAAGKPLSIAQAGDKDKAEEFVFLFNAVIGESTIVPVTGEQEFTAVAVVPEGMAVDHWSMNGEHFLKEAGDTFTFTTGSSVVVEALLRNEKKVTSINAEMFFLDKDGQIGGDPFTEFVFEEPYENPLTGATVSDSTITFYIQAIVPENCEVAAWFINGVPYYLGDFRSFAVGYLNEETVYEVLLVNAKGQPVDASGNVITDPGSINSTGHANPGATPGGNTIGGTNATGKPGGGMPGTPGYIPPFGIEEEEGGDNGGGSSGGGSSGGGNSGGGDNGGGNSGGGDNGGGDNSGPEGGGPDFWEFIDVVIPGTDPDGNDGDGTDGDGTDGNGTNGDGTDGDGTNGDGTNGDGTNGDGTNGDGTNGDGTNGDSTNGDGTNGDGTNGDGTDGSGTNGDGTNGSGTDGDGTNGSGTDGDGSSGDGSSGGGSSGGGSSGGGSSGGGSSSNDDDDDDDDDDDYVNAGGGMVNAGGSGIGVGTIGGGAYVPESDDDSGNSDNSGSGNERPTRYYSVSCGTNVTFSGGGYSGASSGKVPAGTRITVRYNGNYSIYWTGSYNKGDNWHPASTSFTYTVRSNCSFNAYTIVN